MSKKITGAKQLIKKQNMELMTVTPLTDKQAVCFESYSSGKSQVLKGSAGTGKTFIAMYQAFDEILNSKKRYRRVVIVRSAVATRDIGHLPGTIEEKGAIYELAYKGICNELFGRGDAYGLMKKVGAIDFMLTSYVRGITLDETIVIVDEFQNLTNHELDSIMTRLGKKSKIIFCGDTIQSDLTRSVEKNNDAFFKVIDGLTKDFETHTFEPEDIVRSGLVKRYIKERDQNH